MEGPSHRGRSQGEAVKARGWRHIVFRLDLIIFVFLTLYDMGEFPFPKLEYTRFFLYALNRKEEPRTGVSGVL